MLGYIRKVAALKRDEGASAVEYGLLVAAIAALIVVIVFSLGKLVKSTFSNTCNSISSNSGASATCNS